MKKIRTIIASALACSALGLLALAGCASGPDAAPSGASSAAAGGQPAVELQVFAANSLSKAMDEAQELYASQNPGITFADTQYKGSGELNEMLAAGSYADLLVTASKGTMDDAVAEGYVKAQDDLAILCEVPYDSNGKGVVVKKSNTDLLNFVNAVVTKVVCNGDMQKFIDEANAIADQSISG